MFPRFSLRTLMIVFAVVGMTIAMVVYPAMRISRRAQAYAQLKANGIHLWTPAETREHYYYLTKDDPGLHDGMAPSEMFFGWQKALFGSTGGEPRMACVFNLPELQNAIAAGTLSNVGEALQQFPELRMFDSSYGAYIPLTVDNELQRIVNQVAALPELRSAVSEFLDDMWISALPEKTKLLEFRNSTGTPPLTPAAVRMLLEKAPALERLSLNFRSLDEHVTADIQQRAEANREETILKKSPVRLFVRFKLGDVPPTMHEIEFLKTFTMNHEITFVGSAQQRSTWELSGLGAQKINLSGGNSITIRDCLRLGEVSVEADSLVITTCPRLQKIRGECPTSATAATAQISSLPELHSLELREYQQALIEECPQLLDLKLDRRIASGNAKPPGKAILKRSAAPHTLTIVEHELEVEDPAAIKELTLDAESPRLARTAPSLSRSPPCHLSFGSLHSGLKDLERSPAARGADRAVAARAARPSIGSTWTDNTRPTSGEALEDPKNHFQYRIRVHICGPRGRRQTGLIAAEEPGTAAPGQSLFWRGIRFEIAADKRTICHHKTRSSPVAGCRGIIPASRIKVTTS
jgi:hypothetical protein